MAFYNWLKILPLTTSLDRSRGIENRSKTLFDRSNKNQIVIDSGKSSWIIFLIISIDRVKDLTDWIYWISNFHLENSRTWIFTLSTLWNNILQTQISLLQLIHVYTYIYNMWDLARLLLPLVIHNPPPPYEHTSPRMWGPNFRLGHNFDTICNDHTLIV